MRPAIFRIPLTLLAIFAAAAALALPGPAASESCPAIDPPAAIGPGVRAFVDPATGKLRPPTTEEKRQAVLARDRSGRTYEVVVRPDGTRVVELDDAFAMSVVATKGPDGTLRHRCVTGRPAAGAGEK